MPVATATSYSLKITAKELVKKDGKPKVRIDKIDGVKVTVDAFDDTSMKANVNVEISKIAFPKAENITGKNVKITLNYEGIMNKVFEIHFSKDSKN